MYVHVHVHVCTACTYTVDFQLSWCMWLMKTTITGAHLGVLKLVMPEQPVLMRANKLKAAVSHLLHVALFGPPDLIMHVVYCVHTTCVCG